MTKPIKASEPGLEPHYKVRVVLPGVLLHLASWDEPRVERNPFGVQLSEAPIAYAVGWVADWIDDPDYGDTIGAIDWSKVSAVTWRYAA